MLSLQTALMDESHCDEVRARWGWSCQIAPCVLI